MTVLAEPGPGAADHEVAVDSIVVIPMLQGGEVIAYSIQ